MLLAIQSCDERSREAILLDIREEGAEDELVAVAGQ